MNWRAILGLILLIVGMMGLYTVMGNRPLPGSMSASGVKTGCIIWMAVGVFLIIKGTTKRPEQ